MKLFYFLFLVSILLLSPSCKKEAGEGGTSFIKGKVYARYYDKNFLKAGDSAYAPDVDVYITYGDESSVGDRLRTSHDGSYEFKYLRVGSYQVYAYSKDSTGAYKYQVNQFSPPIPIIQRIEITKRKQTVEAPDINIIQ